MGDFFIHSGNFPLLSESSLVRVSRPYSGLNTRMSAGQRRQSELPLQALLVAFPWGTRKQERESFWALTLNCQALIHDPQMNFAPAPGFPVHLQTDEIP